MLSRLTIDNYALIDKSIIDFQEGFTVITGETGAGKSIMLDAMGLLGGARADSKAMGTKERKTTVEGFFSNPDPSLKSILENNNIDWDDNELILRREISVSGKSRGFINDSPVNLALMGEVASKLIDIHSQHSNAVLNKPAEQLAIIDAFGKNEEILNEYKETFRKYVSLRNKIKNIKENIQKGKENLEFISFRLEQLDKLKPRPGELAALEREYDILGDADRIKSSLTEAGEIIGGGSGSILKLLHEVNNVLGNIDFDLLDTQGESDIAGRIDTIRIELRDISDTLEGYAENISSDPSRLEKVQSRIENLYEAMKRFKVKDETELVALHQELREEYMSITGEDTDISALEVQLKKDAKILKEKADLLSKLRENSAQRFADLILSRICHLGLPNIQFEVKIEKGKMTIDGQDNVIFYCSFNKNHNMQPVSEIASGGEIARLMLGIKAVMADHMNLPTIIFDEIDTGVSGEIAHKMGVMMREMSKGIQVMSVTHLPQVAANGNLHLKVFKKDDKEKTVSHIKLLSPEERITEIAAMLSGNTINEAALENARILMGV